MLSRPGLVKQVLPSRDSCWLARAIVAVASLSPIKGKMALQTIVLTMIRGKQQQQQQQQLQQGSS